jgi:D-amino-acid dehydrogenase
LQHSWPRSDLAILGFFQFLFFLRNPVSRSSSSTIIIGAGVVGVCTAYYLAKRGQKVTIIERDRIEHGASKGNAGIIALGHPPLPRPGLVWKTIKWMLDGGSPLYVPPRIDFGLFSWMWNFRKACTDSHFADCMRILAEWGWATGKCWDSLIDDEKIDCEYNRTGWMDIFRTEDGMKHGMLEADLLRKYGFNVDVLSGDELRKREPAFRKEIVGAAHYTDSRFANPRKFVTQLAERVQEMGVEVLTEKEVVQIARKNGSFSHVVIDDGRELKADTLVIAAGVWTSDLSKTLGVRVPMQAGKGYHVNLTAPDPCPSTACVLNETYVAVTPMGGGLRLAGTVELSGTNHRLMQKRVDMLSAGARNYLEGIDKTKIITSWCGLRPCTADGLPVIDWAPKVKNVFIATGHAKYGFAYGPITGKLTSDCVLGDSPSLDLSPMRADRF